MKDTNGLYYKMWAYFQKQEVTFFCWPETAQTLAVVFGLICISNAVIDGLYKYGFFKSKD